jgi:hypothetical protein
VSAIRDLASNNEANSSIDVVDPLVGVLHQQLGEHLLLGTQYHSVLALHTQYCPTSTHTYSALYTAFPAYYSCKIRPSCVYVIQS